VYEFYWSSRLMRAIRVSQNDAIAVGSKAAIRALLTKVVVLFMYCLLGCVFDLLRLVV